MSRLVLDDVDEGTPPSLLGLSSALSDTSLVFQLNHHLRWALGRVEDHRCVQTPLRTTHALYRGHLGAQEQALFWNITEESAWLSGHAPASQDLFSAEDSDAPKRPLVQKPARIHAVLILDPPLSPAEMVILQRQIAQIPGVVGQNILPWSTLRVRDHFLLEPLNTL